MHVPVLGSFASAVFLRPFVDKAATLLGDYQPGVANKALPVHIQGKAHSASELRDRLKTSLFNVWRDIIRDSEDTGGYIRETTNDLKEWSVFNNPSRLPDGNTYGFALNVRGVAIGGFPAHTPEPGVGCSNVYLRQLTVRNLGADVNEVPALTVGPGQDGTSQSDALGSVFQTQNVDANGNLVTIDGNGRYVGNPIADCQLLVAKAKLIERDFGHLDVSRSTISAYSIDWAAGAIPSLSSIIGEENWLFGTYTFNGDTMFHVNKGVIGYKLDGAFNLLAHGLKLKNLFSKGTQGYISSTLPVPTYTSEEGGRLQDQQYINRESKSHPGATLPGYNGAAARGISLASSGNVHLTGCSIWDSASQHGVFYGIDVQKTSFNVEVVHTRIHSVFGGSEGCFGNNINERLDNCFTCGIRFSGGASSRCKLWRVRFSQNTWEEATFKVQVGQSGSSSLGSSSSFGGDFCVAGDDSMDNAAYGSYGNGADTSASTDTESVDVDGELASWGGSLAVDGTLLPNDQKGLELVTGLPNAAFNGRAIVIQNQHRKIVGCGEFQEL